MWDVTVEPVLLGIDEAVSAGWPVFTGDGLLVSPEGSGDVSILDPLRFDAVTGRFERVQTLTGGHTDEPDGFTSVTADQSLITTAGPDAAVLWDNASGQPMLSFGENLTMAIDPLGRFVWTASFNLGASGAAFGSPTIWSLDSELWRTQACVAAGRNLTQAEWERWLPPGEPYRAICPHWPAFGG